MNKASAARARVRASTQTQIAANPSAGLAAEAALAGQALFDQSIQSIPPGDQPSSSRAYSPWSQGQAPLPAWLPPPAQDVLSRLAKRVDDRRRVTQSLSVNVHGHFVPGGVTPGLQTKVLEARQALARLVDPREVSRRGGGFVLPDSHDTVIQARKTLAALEAELAAASARMQPDDEASLLIRVQAWLASSQLREAAEPVTVSRTDTVASIRAEREDLLQKLDAVDEAPVHSEEIKRKISAEIQSRARVGEPTYGQRSINWPRRNETVQANIVGQAGDEPLTALAFVPDRSDDAVGLVCSLLGDELIGVLHAKVDTSRDSSALTDAQKKSQITKIEQDILRNERAECLKIEAGGNAVAYRASTDCRALLGLV